jgi:hypothetical protein
MAKTDRAATSMVPPKIRSAQYPEPEVIKDLCFSTSSGPVEL